MNEKNIIIFGAGYEGVKALNRIGRNRVIYYVDNNKKLFGEYICNKKIINVQELKAINEEDDLNIVVSTRKYFEEIKQQLVNNGIKSVALITNFLIKEAFEGKDNKKRIILMNTHAGTNIGDQLITEAEYIFFENYLPEYAIVELPADLIYEDINEIKKYIRSDDTIAISGGGYMGSLWVYFGEDNVRRIVQSFPDNRIIVMPQSIFFESTKEAIGEYELSEKIYKSHNDFSICAREKKSYKVAQKLLSNNEKVYLFPDMVELFDKSSEYHLRNRAGICFRSDEESILSEQQKKDICSYVKEDMLVFDMHTEEYVGINDRKQVVDRIIKMVSSLKYVITDRLHCMLLCAITGTPCISLNNLTGKVYGVYEWIKSNKYIHLAEDMSSIKKLICICENDKENYQYDSEQIKIKFKELEFYFRDI